MTLSNIIYDWPEAKESFESIYWHKCLHCSVQFYGYKQRRVCKLCYNMKQKEILEGEEP